MSSALTELPADPRELFADIRVVSLPMVTKFRGITTREAMLLRGPAGWAEFSPFTEYEAPEAARWLAAAVEFATTDYTELAGTAESTTGAGRGEDRRGLGLAGRRGAAPTPVPVPVNGTVPACDPAKVPQLLARYDGVGTAKIKVAEDGLASLDEDRKRISVVMATAPELRLRLDANGKYDRPGARKALEAFAKIAGLLERLEYVEQPVMDTEDLARVHEWVAKEDLGIRIAADESIRKADDPLRVAQLGAADHIIVKVQPLGGVQRARDVVAAAGLPVTVSSALDTSVGLSAGVALAAALRGPTEQRRRFSGLRRGTTGRPVEAGGEPGDAAGIGGAVAAGEYAAGLGTASLFSSDVADPPLLAHDGALPVARVLPDEGLLEAAAASPARQEWWRARLDACWTHLRTHGV